MRIVGVGCDTWRNGCSTEVYFGALTGGCAKADGRAWGLGKRDVAFNFLLERRRVWLVKVCEHIGTRCVVQHVVEESKFIIVEQSVRIERHF